jgi:hypothetical protein
MKTCKTCKIEKLETEFYPNYKSPGKTESNCKVCRYEKDKLIPKITYPIMMDGYKTCQICKVNKNVLEFGLNRAIKTGRQPICKTCNNIKINLDRRRNGPIYKPLNISILVPQDTEYKCAICEVCDTKFAMCRPNHKRCNNCTDLVCDIHGKFGKRIKHKMPPGAIRIQLAIDVAKIFITTDKCIYCKRQFTIENNKNIDHINPLNLGGIHELKNIAICCKECNRSKNRQSLYDWLNLCKLIAKNSVEEICLNLKSPPYLFSNLERQCLICSCNINGYHHFAKTCSTCRTLVRKIGSSLSSTRKGKSAKVTADVSNHVARKWISTNECCYCKRGFDNFITKSIDHINPFYLNGNNTINNLTICCLECNRAKYAFSLEHWIDLCKLIAMHN